MTFPTRLRGRPSTIKPEVVEAILRDLMDPALTQQAVADKHGVSRQHVSYYKKKAETAATARPLTHPEDASSSLYADDLTPPRSLGASGKKEKENGPTG